jgi:uncharacterized coiled-coil protein SlyX
MSARIAELEAMVAGRDIAINKLQGTLEERNERIKGLLAELADRGARITDLRATIADDDRRITELIADGDRQRAELASETQRRWLAGEAERMIDQARAILFDASKLVSK